jgi:hypothetical protein
MRRPVSTLSFLESPESAMFGRVVRESVLPHAPDHSDPGTTKDADGVRMVAAASPRPSVYVSGPRVPVAGRIGEGSYRVAQAFVAGPTEGGHLAPAGFDRHRAHAGIGSQRLGARVADATVTDLGHEPSGGDGGLGIAKEQEEDRAVGMGSHGVGDLGGEEPYLLDDRLEGGHQREHRRPARLRLDLTCSATRRAAQPSEEFGGLLPAAVAVAGEEGRKALLAEAAGILGAGVALQEGQRDRGVEIREDAGGSWPEKASPAPRAGGWRAPRASGRGPRGHG